MTTTSSPARTRAEKFAAMAPAGAVVTFHEDTYDLLGKTCYTVQVTLRGSIDTILVTIGGRDTGRTRVSACSWFNSGGRGSRKIPVGHLGYRIRSLYI